MWRSCSGSSTFDQSGRCSGLHSSSTRDGKLAAASTGIAPSPSSPISPAGVAAACTVKLWPSRRMTKLESQASSRTAVVTMASNTGCTSVGELLMTRSISAVAVWRLSASFVSLNSRAFWIAITAWSAKDLISRASSSLNGCRSK